MVKNIVIVTQYFAPAWEYGGPPRVLYTLAKALIKNQFEVNVITSDSLGKERNKTFFEIFDGIKIHRFRALSNWLAYRKKLFFIPNLLVKTKHILDNSDLVLFSELRTLINWRLYHYLVEHKIPYGIFAYGCIPPGEGIKSLLKQGFDIFWVRDFVAQATYRFAQTDNEKKMFQKCFGVSLSQVQFLPLALDSKIPSPEKNKIKAFKVRWDIKNSDKILLFVGRLNYLKGVDLLIEAVIPLLKKDKNLKLMIVGRDDGEEKNLHRIIASDVRNKIIFTGGLYEDDVYCAYMVAKCFILTPRHFEETSLAALEALACGVPVVTTKKAMIPYLLDYSAGFMVEDEKNKVREAVKSLLAFSPKHYQVVRNNAKKLVRDHFSAGKVVKQLIKTWE